VTPAIDRAAWLRQLRRENTEQEDALSAVYDERWGEIEDAYRAFVERFLSSLPVGGGVLDAACGTGKYFGMVLGSGRSVIGVDHSAGHLARAREKFPDVPTELRELQELPYRGEFDGVLCVDALEMIPPEDWSVVLEGFRLALRPGGLLYLTVERVPDEQIRRGTGGGPAGGTPGGRGRGHLGGRPLPPLSVHGPSVGVADRCRVRRGRSGGSRDEGKGSPTTISWLTPRSASSVA
jgi:SAM-dependent methyltransferase